MCEGRKDDGGKLRMDLLAPEAIRGIAEVLTYGVESGKYEDRNWEAGVKWSKYYAALLRHLVDAWWAGEDFDKESGLHHLDHAACCLHFLQTYRHTRKSFDDRPINTPLWEVLERIREDEADINFQKGFEAGQDEAARLKVEEFLNTKETRDD